MLFNIRISLNADSIIMRHGLEHSSKFMIIDGNLVSANGSIKMGQKLIARFNSESISINEIKSK